MTQPQLDSREIIELIVYTFLAFLLMSVSVIIFIYYSRKKILKKELEKKQLEVNYQKKLLQSTLLTQEEERSRIAQNLHDEISSKMNVIALNANLLSSTSLSQAETQNMVSGIISISGSVLESSRRIAHDLLPPVLEKFGLHAALTELCHSHNNPSLSVEYNNDRKEAFFERNDKDSHLHIFRIIQELVNNSIRHGKASHIKIHAFENEMGRHITYTDNGIGFNSDDLNTKIGLGMKNIESRATFIHANFTIQSIESKGVIATLVL